MCLFFTSAVIFNIFSGYKTKLSFIFLLFVDIFYIDIELKVWRKESFITLFCYVSHLKLPAKLYCYCNTFGELKKAHTLLLSAGVQLHQLAPALYQGYRSLSLGFLYCTKIVTDCKGICFIAISWVESKDIQIFTFFQLYFCLSLSVPMNLQFSNTLNLTLSLTRSESF